MDNLSHQAARTTLLAFLISVLLLLTISKTVFCQQTAARSAPTPQADSGSEPTVLTVTVMNKSGDFVMGLNKSNFAIFDGKQTQDITYFRGPDEPVSVGIIFDASGSMLNRSDLLKTFYREALSRFIQQSNEANIYFLIGFNERPQLLSDWRRGTDAINDFLSKLNSIELEGNTAFYDACYLGIEKLARSAHRKRAIILIGDGQDNESRYTFNELRQRLRESGVLFYAVAINSTQDIGSVLGMQGQGILDELAVTSGGMLFLPEESSHVRNVFDRIASELRHQYSIGFIPAASTQKSEWRRLKIKLNIPPGAPLELQKLIVRSREGYYSTTKRQ